MNCQEARGLFDLHVDGALDAGTSAKLEQHLEHCSSCQAAYNAVEAETDLLKRALQSEVSTADQIAMIESRVRREIRPARTLASSIAEWVPPFLGTLLGVLVLIWGRFDGTGVREAISLSLSPHGGLPVAISSLLVAALGVVAVIMIQPLLFRIGEQN